MDEKEQNYQKEHFKMIERIESYLTKGNHPINGTDDDDEYEYHSILQFWKSVGILSFQSITNNVDTTTTKSISLSSSSTSSSLLTQDQDQDLDLDQDSCQWYEQASDHYEDQPATLQGMLGGFASLSPHDLSSSKTFLLHIQKYIKPNITFESICDCGAGIGRITKGLFAKLSGFEKCDLVEGSFMFLKQAEEYLKKDTSIDFTIIAVNDQQQQQQQPLHNTKKLPQCRLINKGLQDFVPQSKYYNIIWIQWVIGYLTDYDCIQFLKRCAKGLTTNGIICIKDNMIASHYGDTTTTNHNDDDPSKAFIFDKEDSSVTRSKAYLEALMDEAGSWTKIYEQRQEGFPKEIFPVWMMAYEVKHDSI